MTVRKNIRLDFLDNLRAIGIVMVVCINAFSYTPNLDGSVQYFISILLSIAVPIFFMVDGFLLANNKDKMIGKYYLRYIKLSAHRLLIPWFIFTFTYTVIRYFLEMQGMLINRIVVGHPLSSVILMRRSTLANFTFLCHFFLLRLTVPLVLYVVRLKNMLHVFVVFGTYVAIYHIFKSDINAMLYIESGQEPLLHAFWGMQFYLFGVVVYFLYSAKCIGHLLALISISMITMYFAHAHLGIVGVVLLQVIYLFWITIICYVYSNRLNFLKNIGINTMGIYLLHAPVIINLVALLVNKLINIPVINAILVSFVTLLISLFVTMSIKRIPFGGILFGEKVK